MTVTSTNRTNEYVADGIQTVFPYTFVIFAASTMRVFFNGVEQLSGFTVDGVGNPAGGNVTFGVAPLDQVGIRLSRIVPILQEINYTAFDPFPAEVNEQGLDQGVMIDQQQQDQIDALTAAGGVLSVFGRSGNVTANPGDYTASAITNLPAGNITATDVQDALNELDADKLVATHQGLGGAVHAQVTGAVDGFMIAADKTKLDGIEFLAEVNDVFSVFGRTGAVVAAPGDYTNLDVLTVGTFTSAGIDDNATSLALTIDVNGRLMRGHATPIATGGGLTPFIQSHGTAGSSTSMALFSWNSAFAEASLIFARSMSGDIGVVTAVALDDELGRIDAAGADVTTTGDLNTVAVRIKFEVDGVVAADQVPGRMIIETADAAGTLREAMRFNAAQGATFAGGVVLTGASPVLFINETVNANMTTGLTITSAATDEMIALKGDNVGHPMTALTELDTFATITAESPSAGGVLLTGYRDADGTAGRALRLEGVLGEVALATTSTSAAGVTEIRSAVTDGGTGKADVADNGNILAIRNNTLTRILVKGNGDTAWTGVTARIALGVTPTATAFLHIQAGTTASASMRIPHGVAPTAPVNGDMWTDTSGLNVRINGATLSFTAST